MKLVVKLYCIAMTTKYCDSRENFESEIQINFTGFPKELI